MNYRYLFSWPSRHPARAGALAGWIQQSVSLGSALLLVPIVTTFLPPAEAGIWFVFQSLLGMMSLIDLGFGFAVARQVAFTMGGSGKTDGTGFVRLAQGWEGLAQLFRLTRRLYLLLALGAGLFGLLIFELMATTGHLAASVSEPVRYCWYYLVVAAAFLVAAGGQAAFLNGLGVVYQTRLVSAVYTAFAAVAAAVAVSSGLGLPGMGAAFAIASVTHYVVVLNVRKAATPKLLLVKPKSIPSGSFRSLCKASLPVGGVNIFGSLMYSAQTPLLGFLLGPEKVAPFFLAQKIALACNQAVLHTVSPQMPFFTRQYGEGNYAGALHLMNRTLVSVAVLVLMSSAAFFLLSPFAAKLLLNRTEFLASLPLALIALDVCLLGLTVPWAWFVLAGGRNPFVLTTIAGGMVSISLCFVLVPQLGVLGVPLSSLIAGLLTNYWFAIYQGLVLRRSLAQRG